MEMASQETCFYLGVAEGKRGQGTDFEEFRLKQTSFLPNFLTQQPQSHMVFINTTPYRGNAPSDVIL